MVKTQNQLQPLHNDFDNPDLWMRVGEIIASYMHIYLSVAEDRSLLFASSLCKSQLVRQLINRNQASVRAKRFLTTLSTYKPLLKLLLFCFVAETVGFQEIAVK